MAIDKLFSPDATNLAHPEKAFYPVRVPVSHWQLRHYISAPEPDLLYYASGHDIYCLNTSTKKRKHIATLPFEARCTASGYGYVCVGGEDDGHFAAIKIDGCVREGAAVAVDGEVDSTLANGDSSWRSGSGSGSNGSNSGNGGVGRRATSVKVERIGEEIVNSISIHRLQDESAHLDDIVAVLTNNDKTVRIYSLPHGVETRVLDLPFPFAMNHATISPDGCTLIAVGDFNQAYFFQRDIAPELMMGTEASRQIPKPHNRLNSASIEWTLTSVVNLHVSAPEATTGYFTTAWSPSGQLVAVGSEGGYITVFDIDILHSPEYDDEESVVAIIPSSRADIPPPHPGAVRSMMFAPEPWDLLIWAEDQGRVCIGDLRTGLRTKQVIHLEPQDPALRKVALEDVPPDSAAEAYANGNSAAGGSIGVPTRDIDELEAEFIRRYRQAPDNATAVNFATEYIEARRRQRQQRDTSARSSGAGTGSGTGLMRSLLLEDDPRGLSAREQQILESLRTTRQREEARSRGEPPPPGGRSSVNYTTAEMFAGNTARSSSATPNTYESSATMTVPDSFPELSRTQAASTSAPGRPSSSHERDLMTMPPTHVLQQEAAALRSRGSDASLVRLSDGSRLPRRRQSVVLTPTSSSTNTNTGGNPALHEYIAQRAQQEGIVARRDRTAADEEEEENPWQTIEEHMTLARGPLFERVQPEQQQQQLQSGSPPPSGSITTRNVRSSEAELQADLAVERARARSLARQRERWRSIRATGGDPAGGGGGGMTAVSAASPTGSVPANIAEARRLAAFPEGYETLLRRTQLRGFGIASAAGAAGPREIGVRTAGLAMSGDGRVLWAACEEGIFEVRMNVKGRMFWPGVEVK